MLRRGFLKSTVAMAGWAAPATVFADSNLPVYLAVEGDSISADSLSYANLYGTQDDTVLHWIWAISGSNLSNLIHRAPKVDGSIDTKKYSKHILSVLLAVDLIAPAYKKYGGSRQAYLMAVAEYLDARRAAGWKVVLCTTLPETREGFNVERNLCNAVLRTWVGTHCDFLCDFASDSAMGRDISAENLDLYYDGIHPSELGHKNLKTIFSRTMELAIA